MSQNRAEALTRLDGVQRVVIKVGTSLLTDPAAPQSADRGMIEKLREEILFLRERGIETVLVSSGSVGMGREMLKEIISYTPLANPNLVRRQALAAVGQSRLISVYGEIFSEKKLPVAQLLITARDFHDRRSYLNIGNTLEELIALGVTPIVNENDTVSVDELRYGDNDVLSAAVASLFRAELLVILTSVSGFLMNGERVSFLPDIGEKEEEQAGGPEGPGSGGMITKLRAGRLCRLGGELLAILPGRAATPLRSLFRGEDIGTLIGGEHRRKLSARKRWLLYALPQGRITVDRGARTALLERGSSLLPAGALNTRGHFLAGDVIDIADEDGLVLGRGLSNYSYREVRPLMGRNAETLRAQGSILRAPEIIHRNNMILES